MNNNTPEALRLARMIEHYNAGVGSQRIVEDYQQAAAELRRLYFENEKLRAALAEQPAEPDAEPVAWLDGPHLVMRSDWRDRANYKGPWVAIGRAIPDSWVPALYTSPPPSKPWVGLTNKEWQEIVEDNSLDTIGTIKIAIEAKLKEKNA